MNDLTNGELAEQIRIKWSALKQRLENHEITSREYARRRKAYDYMIGELILKDEDRLPIDNDLNISIDLNLFEGGIEEAVILLQWRLAVTCFQKLGYYSSNKALEENREILINFDCYFNGYTDAELIEYVKRLLLYFEFDHII